MAHLSVPLEGKTYEIVGPLKTLEDASNYDDYEEWKDSECPTCHAMSDDFETLTNRYMETDNTTTWTNWDTGETDGRDHPMLVSGLVPVPTSKLSTTSPLISCPFATSPTAKGDPYQNKKATIATVLPSPWGFQAWDPRSKFPPKNNHQRTCSKRVAFLVDHQKNLGHKKIIKKNFSFVLSNLLTLRGKTRNSVPPPFPSLNPLNWGPPHRSHPPTGGKTKCTKKNFLTHPLLLFFYL
eukprot:FR741115.1.p1 GENE.FR741115.1~~FR741115.1.p1  ORF type:complete len:238 (+),score=45.53 FR741115.1:516-1229(+)